MRVLLLNYEYPPIGGGAGIATQALARGLAARGVTVDVVTAGRRDECGSEVLWDGHAAEEGLLTVYRVKQQPDRGPRGRDGGRPQLSPQRAPAGARPDAGRALRHRARVLLAADRRHAALPESGRHAGHRLAPRLRRPGIRSDLPRTSSRAHTLLLPLTRRIWRRANRVVARARAWAVSRSAPIPRLRYSVIPNGVDLTGFRPSARARSRHPAKVRCLAVSRLVERKGLADLILAIASLERAATSWRSWAPVPTSSGSRTWPSISV